MQSSHHHSGLYTWSVAEFINKTKHLPYKYLTQKQRKIESYAVSLYHSLFCRLIVNAVGSIQSDYELVGSITAIKLCISLVTMQRTFLVNNNVVVIFYYERKIYISGESANIHFSFCQVRIFLELLVFYLLLYFTAKNPTSLFSSRDTAISEFTIISLMYGIFFCARYMQ